MFQIQDTRASSKNEDYNTPSRQQIVIKGNDSTEMVSVPGLQTYFTNLTMSGRESAYFQVTYLDFPINDSLTKTFGGDTIDLTLEAKQYYRQMDGAGAYSLTGTYAMTVNVNRISSIKDLSERLWIGMMNIRGPVDATMNWKAHLSTLEYDSDSQKLNLSFTGRLQEVSPPGFPSSTKPPMLDRITITLTNSMTGRQGKLAAAIFGGKASETGNWSTQWDTQSTQFFEAMYHRIAMTQDLAYIPPDYFYQLVQFNYLTVPGQRPCKMFVDPYVYVRGTPEQSIWTQGGESQNLLTIQPRNRPAGYITQEQAFLGAQTHTTKSSLVALRSMFLTFTDSDGNPIMVDEDYMMKINIEFQR